MMISPRFGRVGWGWKKDNGKMKKLLAILLAILLSSCSLLGKATPIPQATPPDRPALQYVKFEEFEIAGCASDLHCPDATLATGLLGNDTSVNFDKYFLARIASGDAIRFVVGWCTNEPSLLPQNLEHIEFIFDVDGYSYVDTLESQSWSQPGAENNQETEYCYQEGAVIRNWDRGIYHIQFGFRIHEEIYDGWETYSPQEYIRYYALDVAG